MFAALDHPARQGLAWDIDTVAAHTFSKRCSGRPSTYLVVSNIANTLGLAMLFFDQLRRLVGGNRVGFAIAATVDLAHMFDHTDLHRHDLELLADFLANGVLTATAGAGQLVLGQFVNDLDTGQVGGQRPAFAAAVI
ncbi:hypothetical protein ABH909_002855 [Pseudomonas sp. BS3782 TE3695]